MDLTTLKLVQSRDDIKANPAQVGKAVVDILSKSQAPQSVEDTLDAMTPRYYEELLATIDANKNRYSGRFYIVVLRKKEPWAVNVLRQWFVARQTKPSARTLRTDFPNCDHDVWSIEPNSREGVLEWTLPTHQDSKTILKNKNMYDENLVRWIQEFETGSLL